MSSSTAWARAHSNIALIKYWGKRDAALNLPAVGSISLTLDNLYTDTRVRFDPALAEDSLSLDGAAPTADKRTTAFLDRVRAQAGIATRAAVVSRNNFPTAAGLASSASGFAALALAATRAAGVELDARQLSILARQGSGSAARSVFGGLVQMHRGERDDGSDAFAEPLAPTGLELALVVAITTATGKAVDSTAGMTANAQAPYYPAWVASAPADLAAMRAALAGDDLHRVGELVEHSCLKMHALMLSARPALLYWNPATVALMHAVRRLRADGLDAWFTIDAGPQVKVLCRAADAAAVADALQAVPGVHALRLCYPGPGAHALSEAEFDAAGDE